VTVRTERRVVARASRVDGARGRGARLEQRLDSMSTEECLKTAVAARPVFAQSGLLGSLERERGRPLPPSS